MKKKIVIIISLVLVAIGTGFAVGYAALHDKKLDVPVNEDVKETDKKEIDDNIDEAENNKEDDNSNTEVDDSKRNDTATTDKNSTKPSNSNQNSNSDKKPVKNESNTSTNSSSSSSSDNKNNTVNKDNNSSTNKNNSSTNNNNSSTNNNANKNNNSSINNNKNNTANKNNNSSANNNSNNTNESKPAAKTLVSTEIVNESATTPKYNAKIIKTTSYEVKKYSDGTIEKKEIGTSTRYDKTGFKATTNDLKSEAQTLANKNKKIYQDVLKNVNKYRAEIGVSPLVLDETLTVAATIRSLEQAWTDDLSHTRPNGTSCFTVVSEMNIPFSAMAENVAYGYGTANSVSEGWRTSPGHYANMTNANFNKIGIGMAQLDGSLYWTQLFYE